MQPKRNPERFQKSSAKAPTTSGLYDIKQPRRYEQIAKKPSAPLFVRLSKFGGKSFGGLGRNAKLSAEEADIFDFLGFDITAAEYRATYYGFFAYGLVLAVVLAAAMFFFLDFDVNLKFLFAAILVLSPIALSYLYLKMPFMLAEREKKLALAYTPEIVNYLVMSMRLTPNLEKAVEFAAIHGRGKIAEDLKTVIWQTQLGTFYSVEEGLDNLAYRWGPYSEEFKHALMLIRSSIMETDAVRRGEMLERAAADVLEGSKEKMDIYARQLHQPTVYLYYFGILLPLLLAIILPIAGAMTGLEIAKGEYLFVVYNLLIPVGIFLFGSNILGTRPPTYVPPEIPEDFPGLPKKGIWEIGSLKLPYKAAAFAILAGFVFAGFLADKFVFDLIPAYEDKEAILKGMVHVTWFDQFGIFVGQFTISAALLGTALAVCVYLLGKYSARKRIQDEVRDMETEFKDALYVLASRLGENRPMEEALRQAIEFLPKSKIASEVFRRILENVTGLGMTIEAAIFDPTYGAIKNYPSQIIRGGLRIMVDSVELGVNVAAKSLISLSMQIRNQQKIDEMLRKLLSDVTTMLSTMSIFIAPVVLAVVSALQRMVTGALTSSCANQAEAGAGLPAAGGFGSLSSTTSFCKGDLSKVSADPATFVFIMGLYTIEVVILLTYFNSQIEDTNNDLHTYISIAKALPVATFLYVAVAYLVSSVILVQGG